jgi:tRNA modification GTPase
VPLNRTAADACRIVVLTPPGRGAIATVAISGADAAAMLRSCLVSASGIDPARFGLERIYFARWIGAEKPSTPETAETAAARSAPEPGTGEEVVVRRRGETEFEIHCHGGAAACQRILDALETRGAMRLTLRQWLEVSTSNGLEAAAIEALAAARTTRTAGILLDQYRGALRTELAEITDLLARTPDLAIQRLERLDRLSAAGTHLTTPWRIVLAGLPNVGKSSLMNALLGFDRCIVLDQPGTTRDVVTATTALDGWLVELHDTAGLRLSADAIESEGVERARAQVADADLVLLVIDSSDPQRTAELHELAPRPNVLEVWNKADLAPAGTEPTAGGLRVSARTGAGIDLLIRESLQRLVVAWPRQGEAVPFTQRSATAIAEALHLARTGQAAIAAAMLTEID